MRKHFKWLSLAVGVVMLVGALGIGTAFAADPTPTPTDYFNAFMAKVAKTLGIDQQKLVDAVNQARSETIDEAVRDGRITQEQADWMKQCQEQGGFGPGFAGGRFGGYGRFGATGAPFGGPWAQPAPSPAQ